MIRCPWSDRGHLYLRSGRVTVRPKTVRWEVRSGIQSVWVPGPGKVIWGRDPDGVPRFEILVRTPGSKVKTGTLGSWVPSGVSRSEVQL